MKRRHVDPVAALFAEERNVALSVAADQHMPHQDRDGLVHDTFAAVLRHFTRATFVLLGDEHLMRATVRAYLATTARRIVWERRYREQAERDAPMPLDTYDPRPMYEARSDLRALDLPPVAVALFQAIVHEGSVFRAAARMRWPVGPPTPAVRHSGRTFAPPSVASAGHPYSAASSAIARLASAAAHAGLLSSFQSCRLIKRAISSAIGRVISATGKLPIRPNHTPSVDRDAADAVLPTITRTAEWSSHTPRASTQPSL